MKNSQKKLVEVQDWPGGLDSLAWKGFRPTISSNNYHLVHVKSDHPWLAPGTGTSSKHGHRRHLSRISSMYLPVPYCESSCLGLHRFNCASLYDFQGMAYGCLRESLPKFCSCITGRQSRGDNAGSAGPFPFPFPLPPDAFLGGNKSDRLPFAAIPGRNATTARPKRVIATCSDAMFQRNGSSSFASFS